MGESERRTAYEAAASHLPAIDMSGWVWTEDEVNVLRKACAVRFGEDIRTESLFKIAVAAMRIAKGREAELSRLEALRAGVK